MIRTTILLALFVLIPLVVCSSQDQDSESSKVTTENRPTDKKVNSDGYGVEDCLKSTSLVGRDAAILCNGATSRMPVDCYYSTSLGGRDAALACTERSLEWITSVLILSD